MADKLEDKILELIKKLDEEKRLGDKRAKQLYEMTGSGGLPIGAILPYVGGYFTNGSNAGFTMVMAAANTIVAVNTILNPVGFYVCDGAALNDADSPIFNGAGRYLPNLTDDRFVMGNTIIGGIGGGSSSAHIHGVGTYVNAGESAHIHGVGTYAAGAHKHIAPIVHEPGWLGQSAPWGTVAVTATYYYVSQEGSTTQNMPHCYTSEVAPALTGSSGVGSVHTHVLSGDSGAASVTENRPKFLACLYIMKVK